jgi:hypothetical protein
MSGDMDYNDAIALMTEAGETAEAIVAAIAAIESEQDKLVSLLRRLKEGTGTSGSAPVFGYADQVGISLSDAKVNAHGVAQIMSRSIALLG